MSEKDDERDSYDDEHATLRSLLRLGVSKSWRKIAKFPQLQWAKQATTVSAKLQFIH
jgi:hypothetical protein